MARAARSSALAMSAPSRATKARTPVWALPAPVGAGVAAWPVMRSRSVAMRRARAVSPSLHWPTRRTSARKSSTTCRAISRVAASHGPKPVANPARERLECGAGLRHRLEVRHERRAAQQANLAHELLARHAFGACQQRLEAVQAFARLEGEEIGCAERLAHGSALSPEEVS